MLHTATAVGRWSLVFVLLLPIIAFAASTSSLRKLMEAGTPLECTLDRTDEHGAQQGTVFIAGQYMRGDFMIAARKTKPFQVHTLRDGDWMYSWGGPMGDKQGTKIRLSEMQAGQASKKKRGMDLDQEVEVECKPWQESRAMFVPPKDVAFQDITTQTRQMQQHMQQLQGTKCSACDQVPAGASRDQCRQALGCR